MKDLDCIIIEGGGFRTGFTSGILDAFMSHEFMPFKHFYGISGGSVAMSFYLSEQFRSSIGALSYLVNHDSFTSFRRVFKKEGYMDIDFLSRVANEHFPLDINTAHKRVVNREVNIVVTNRYSGNAEYLQPSKENWLELVTASCTLPFVTKGIHLINGVEYFDGGWGDALPVREAYKKGARNILVLRTWPSDEKAGQSWADYFGSIYFRNNPVLADIFANSHANYNSAIDFIDTPPSDCTITEIAPQNLLNSGTYMYTERSVLIDYRYGLDLGIQFLEQLKEF